jgi:hypothetical protein
MHYTFDSLFMTPTAHHVSSSKLRHESQAQTSGQPLYLEFDLNSNLRPLTDPDVLAKYKQGLLCFLALYALTFDA